jgi:hypothetical protein
MCSVAAYLSVCLTQLRNLLPRLQPPIASLQTSPQKVSTRLCCVKRGRAWNERFRTQLAQPRSKATFSLPSLPSL